MFKVKRCCEPLDDEIRTVYAAQSMGDSTWFLFYSREKYRGNRWEWGHSSHYAPVD